VTNFTMGALERKKGKEGKGENFLIHVELFSSREALS